MNIIDDNKICLFHPDLCSHNFLFTQPPKHQSPCRYEDKHGACKRKRCKFVHRGSRFFFPPPEKKCLFMLVLLGGEFLNPQITGILDWDNCEALPFPLALRVPTWLWSMRGASVNSWDTDAAVYLMGENPSTAPRPTHVIVRETFFAEMETLLPGFTNLTQTSYDNGLLALRCIARFGILQGTAGLTRCLLRRHNLESEAQLKFEALHSQLKCQKNI